MSNIIDVIEKMNLKTDLPEIKIGATVGVFVKLKDKEGSKKGSKTQKYEGIVIAKRGSGIRETITVRKISYGVGVERVFPIHSPMIESIEVVKQGRVRRAKLFYLRDRVGKAAKLKMVINK